MSASSISEPDRRAADEIWARLLRLATGNRSSASDPAPAPDLSDFFELYRPLCLPAADRPRLLGHLGQSIDGCIATASGDSRFVNDQENIRHLHRLRALHDAVIVGAGTVASDDPQLTTRLVTGPNPVRIVLDPGRRLPESHRVFCDGIADSILVVAAESAGGNRHGQAEVIPVATRDGRFDLASLVDRLAERGLMRLFVEGGGHTASAFFRSGLLDRLQIAVAPVLIGDGIPGLRLPAFASMDDCPRPHYRLFAMGEDLLFDCVLRQSDENPDSGATEAASTPTGAQAPIRRLR